MDDLLKAILLGIVQGFTEWLPISSTGHLKICEILLGLKVPLLFDVVLHAGTLVVVLAFFRGDLKAVLKALARLEFKTEHGRLIPLIIVGTVPTAVIGWLLYEFWKDFLQELPTVALAFIVCGIFLWLAKVGREGSTDIRPWEAFLIGLVQGLAVVPGLSRSGLTIAVALLLGIRREKAFKFSFLLSVPAVIGALALTLYEESSMLSASSFGSFETAVGATVAVIVGYSALKLLWRVLTKGKFHLFAFYCWALGVFMLSASFYGIL
ncbi:MAG: undecaprenyl-diphosphate phosphatase [Candidatus Bathyarchaeia archaeon]